MKVRNNSRRWFRLGSVAGVLLVALGAASLTRTGVTAAERSWPLDMFESAIRIVQPNSPEEQYHSLWNLYTSFGSPGVSLTDLSSSEHKDGSQSLHNRFDPSRATYKNWQFQFYPYTIGVPGFSDGWNYARKMIQDPGSWQMGRVNRMRFWIKVPTSIPAQSGGRYNFEVGTYLRDLSWSSLDAENNNWHFYHFYNLHPTGQWEQVILDAHPGHQRSWPGDTEYGEKLYPSSETPDLTYFDLLTRFYFDLPYVQWPGPVDFYLDGFEFFQETAAENVDQVFSIHGVFVPSNLLRVGWSRRKDQESIAHEVRYAFSDIHSLGWNAATPAPGGVVVPPSGSGPYQTLEYSTSSINLSGRSAIFFAIKPQGASRFRQIAIPLDGGGGGGSGSGGGIGSSAPPPPTNLRIVQ